MAPVVYRMSHARFKTQMRAFLGLSTIKAVVALAFGFWFVTRVFDGSTAVHTVVAIAIIVLIARSIRQRSSTGNSLQLDDEGLTYESWGAVHRWMWPELSEFEVRDIMPFWSRSGLRLIPVVTRDGDSGPAALSRQRKPVLIHDDYAVSLDEIAATLNAYRERALGGGDTADGLQAPGPA